MAKSIAAALSIVTITIVVIGTIMLQHMENAAAERHRQQIAAELKAEQQAAAAKAAQLKSATNDLDAAITDGSAGIAGTVVTHLRHDRSQLDDLIAALKLTGSQGAMETTGAIGATTNTAATGTQQAPTADPKPTTAPDTVPKPGR